MKNISKKGVVHGRFQPPHNGHFKYILKVLEKTDHLKIGICTPKICTKEESQKNNWPCTKEQNPFSFEERKKMISLFLNNKKIQRKKYSFIEFPSDYKNIDKIISKDIIFFVAHTSDFDNQKIDYLNNLGYKTKKIVFKKSLKSESGEKIRTSISNQDNTWKKMVPDVLIKYIQNKI